MEGEIIIQAKFCILHIQPNQQKLVGQACRNSDVSQDLFDTLEKLLASEPIAMVAAPNKPITPQKTEPVIAWVTPPDDFVLDDTPVENTGQPLIAGALRESLELAGCLPADGLVASNFGLCVKINQELTLKAPDWLYITQVSQPGLARKSYTPKLEGDIPAIVMEFLSETDGGEYSTRHIPPVGKWHFYEQILRVPSYVIFEPDSGLLEVYRLQTKYVLERPDVDGRHWFDVLGLFLGTWRGLKEGRDGYWLRWWDAAGNCLPWAIEKIEQAQQRADRLADRLRAQGIDPDTID
jgi:Putative restriction endonuclease